MHGAGFFQQAFMYLCAAVVAVPLAKRLGLGSVLGYLLAGMIIGPDVLSLVGDEGQDVMHFAEFGVVMMLFLVGLELEPAVLWRLRGPILGLGGAQVTATALLVMAIALAVDIPWQVALSVGMILALSSTAIVVQTLNEKGLMKTRAGQSAFSVLLFQDIAVIPMLALLPLLATEAAVHGADHEAGLLEGQAAWVQGVVVLCVMSGLVAAGRYLMTPIFRFIAKARLRETFTAAALLLVIGIALLMGRMGLSPALGTFVAGVVLATSEYRHELEAEIEPFKGLLLGLFFIAVGASIDFDLVRERPGTIGLLVVGLMVGKFFVLALLGRAFRLSGDQNWLFSFALAQGGEFAFVLFSFAKKNGVVGTDIANPLIVSVALSMALTPLAMIAHERLILPRFGTKRSASRDQDDVHGDASVIIAGYGRFGQVVARLLKSAGIGSTLLDFDSDQVDLARKFGARVYYGDASRIDLLRAAGADKAKLIVLALDNTQKILELAHEVRKHFPHLTVLARARGRSEAFDLIEAGVEHVYRELLDSSLTVGRQALTLLGVPPHRAHRMSRSFRKYDEQFMRETALRRREQEDWIQFARAQNRDLEQVLAAEHQTEPNDEVTGNSNIEIGKVHQVRAADDDSSREES